GQACGVADGPASVAVIPGTATAGVAASVADEIADSLAGLMRSSGWVIVGGSIRSTSNGERNTTDGSSVLRVVYRIRAPNSTPGSSNSLCRILARTRVNTRVGARATETLTLLVWDSPKIIRRCSQTSATRTGTSTRVTTTPSPTDSQSSAPLETSAPALNQCL